MNKQPCMLCPEVPEEGFFGLCRKCCVLMKAKQDAFAREAARKLEEAKQMQVRIIEHRDNELVL
jgi:hypothetical protein